MTPDAMHAMASKVEREWGYYGYSFNAVEPTGDGGGLAAAPTGVDAACAYGLENREHHGGPVDVTFDRRGNVVYVGTVKS